MFVVEQIGRRSAACSPLGKVSVFVDGNFVLIVLVVFCDISILVLLYTFIILYTYICIYYCVYIHLHTYILLLSHVWVTYDICKKQSILWWPWDPCIFWGILWAIHSGATFFVKLCRKVPWTVVDSNSSWCKGFLQNRSVKQNCELRNLIAPFFESPGGS